MIVALVVSAALLVTLYKPPSIVYQGKRRSPVQAFPLKGSGYRPTPVPSDSAWAAQGDSVRAQRAERKDEGSED